MNTTKMVALGLIAAGALGLAYGSFTYTKDTHEANLGPIKFTVSDRETVNVPVWAGVVAVVIGGGLLLFGAPRRRL